MVQLEDTHPGPEYGSENYRLLETTIIYRSKISLMMISIVRLN